MHSLSAILYELKLWSCVLTILLLLQGVTIKKRETDGVIYVARVFVGGPAERSGKYCSFS